MSSARSSIEIGTSPPTEEPTPSELLEIIALRLPELRQGLEDVGLAERDLRTIAAIDTRFQHALDRADKLGAARRELQTLLDSVVELIPPSALRPLGELAIEQTNPKHKAP